MKKTYIIPQTEVLYLAPATIIAESDPDGVMDPSRSVDAASVDVKGNRYNDWEDDWDD